MGSDGESVRDDEANPWTTLEVAERFRDDFITVEEHAVRDAAGRPSTYGIVRYRHRGLLVIPVHDDGSVTLVGQWRYAAGRYSWEFPAGSIERGEATIEAAKRELQEEAGLVAEQWLELAALTMSPAITDEHATALAAWELRPARRDPDPQEVLKSRRLPFSEALDWALSGRITGAPAVAAMLTLYARQVRGELPEDLSRRLA
ncbi:MAG: NUDIX hydrolase [Alphaproteobacteria bacterium]|nr:NUDIX hydrolase [Alphaproteobacteria bacterium]